MSAGKVVDFVKRGKNLALVLVDREELLEIKAKRDAGDWDHHYAESDLLEWHLGNGWERLAPEEIGALTSCEVILSEEADRDDHGNLTKVGRVYWHPNYMVEDLIDTILEKGEIVLTGADS